MKTKKLIELFRLNQKALSMPTVLIVMMIVTVLGTALYAFSQNELLIATRSTDSKQAEYLARSGIEAALEWWKQEKPKPEGTKNFDRVYMKRDGTMLLDDPGHEKVGYIDVTVEKDADGTWNITSEGTVNGITKTLKASSGKFMTDEDLTNLDDPWYEWNSDTAGVIKKGPDYSDDHEMPLYAHNAVAGVAIIGSSGRTLNLDSTGEVGDYGVGYPAGALFFNSELNLAQSTKVGFLVVAGEKIVFNRRVNIGSNFRGMGVLVLHLPEGFGIPGQELVVKPGYEDNVDIDAKYGLVYFNELRVITFLNLMNRTVISNQAYYFKNLDKGIALFDDEDYLSDFSELVNNGNLIPAGSTVTKPDPEDCAVFFMN